MNITINTKTMQDMIKKISKVKFITKQLPALDSILITTEGNSITATRTDLIRTVVFNIDGIIQETGQIVLPMETVKLLSKLKTNEITIKDSQIIAGNKVLNFVSYDKSIYPAELPNCEIEGFTTTEKELLSLLSVQYTSGKDETKPVFNSVCIDKQNFVAIDTYRLSWKKFDFENKLDKKMIIPLESAKLLSDYLDKKADNQVQCFASNTYIMFKTKEFELYTRLIEGNFPDYTKIIPTDYKTEITINVKETLEELEFINDIAKETIPHKTVTFATDNSTMFIDAENSRNAVTASIKADIVGDQLHYIGINCTYLIEALKHVEADTVTIKCTDKLKPVMIGDSIVSPIRMDNRLNQKKVNVA